MAAESLLTKPHSSREASESENPQLCVRGLNFSQQEGDQISSQGIAVSGLTGFCVAWLLVQRHSISDLWILLLLFLGMVASPMVLLSMLFNRSHQRSTSGLTANVRAVCWPRFRIKYIGFLGTLIMLAGCYWLFPEYAKTFYRPVWEVATRIAVPLLLVSVPYIVWVDRRMVDPDDGYFNMGLILLGRWREADSKKINEYSLGWFVKGFFLPFMVAGMAEHISMLVRQGVNGSTFVLLYVTLLNLLLTIDVLFGSIGYLLTLRITDSHIRSTEPTALGWASAIICYLPFSTVIWKYYLHYKGPTEWFAWLVPHPIIFVSWGFSILMLYVVYVWATISFGCRFSNLTNRGVIVDGPYRFLKHPAYVSKCLSWWLISVPFVAHGTWQECFRACICLFLTCAIYGVRAWTEERHMMNDPAYRAYSEWMQVNGLFSPVSKFLRRLSERIK